MKVGLTAVGLDSAARLPTGRETKLQENVSGSTDQNGHVIAPEGDANDHATSGTVEIPVRFSWRNALMRAIAVRIRRFPSRVHGVVSPRFPRGSG
jgi:hypothetical protein